MAEQNPEQQSQAAPAETMEMGEFESLLKKEFKPKSTKARDAVTTAVQTLAEQALAETALISEDAVKSIESI
ncbi:MAG: hypothetical protein KAJ46_04130, partial [Sedimentisphaerales bacterium]|nr:hypothetical protein [Sedimentisphaerales bacterium]